MNTFEKIYAQVRRIPCGKVATYGQIALLAGNPHWSQVVGYALHGNPEPYDEQTGRGIPCHRVVNRFGKTSEAFAFGGQDRQRALLEAEGIVFTADGRVDLAQYIWNGQ